MAWNIPRRYSNEGKTAYRDRLEKELDRWKRYLGMGDRFRDFQRKDWQRRCKRLRDAINELLDPRSDDAKRLG